MQGQREDDMSQEAVERVLGRLLTDQSFRERAAQSLAQACLEAGYQLSPEELRAVRGQDLELLAELAKQMDGGIKRFCHPGAEPGGNGSGKR